MENPEGGLFGFSSGIPGQVMGSNDLRSQYFGAYATWRNQGGFYVDTVLQSGRHRYTIEPGQSLRSDGKGDSLVGSVEVGQVFTLAHGWQIEPELQLMHQDLSMNDANIIGALVQQQGNVGWSSLITRSSDLLAVLRTARAHPRVATK
jgi:outer membrane autotransporter protein